MSVPSPGWGAACDWEWGGVVEATPLPCAHPMVSRVLGAAAPFVWLAGVATVVVICLLIAVLVRMR